MKRLKYLLLITYYLSLAASLHAQDPAFSQFFSSPLNINPALTANINSDWRVISNYRSQWMATGDPSPYVTGTISTTVNFYRIKVHTAQRIITSV